MSSLSYWKFQRILLKTGITTSYLSTGLPFKTPKKMRLDIHETSLDWSTIDLEALKEIVDEKASQTIYKEKFNFIKTMKHLLKTS